MISVLQEEYLRVPTSEEEWKIVANDYGERWNFFNCIGALDGKHVRIDPPLNSGSMFHNYKGYASVVLLALVDAQLRFIFVDIGTNGRQSDSGIWNRSSLKKHLENNSIHIPEPAPLPHSNMNFPFVIVGDEGFPLTSRLLIPYPKECQGRKDRRIYNYRYDNFNISEFILNTFYIYLYNVS